MFRESHGRSVMKAVSWRIFGTVTTAVLVYVFTKRLVLSLAVGALEFVSKIMLFWMHERFWDRLSWGKKRTPPAVVWFTGLSGSGKSTVADWVAKELERRGLPVERLDGDSIRQIFPTIGFTRQERDDHIRRVGYLAGKLESNGIFVITSFVSPYAESRRFVRQNTRSFIEVYVATPIEECERRDTKGLYARARRGEIANFTGVNDPYEPPESPEVTLDTTRETVEQSGKKVLAALELRGVGP